MIYLKANSIWCLVSLSFLFLFFSFFQFTWPRIEACLFGVYPLVPNRLVYPELYPSECLYSTQPQLVKRLKHICARPRLFRLSRHEHFSDNKRHQSSSSNSVVAIPSNTSACNSQMESRRRPPEQQDNYFDKYKWSAVRPLFLDAFALDD